MTWDTFLWGGAPIGVMCTGYPAAVALLVKGTALAAKGKVALGAAYAGGGGVTCGTTKVVVDECLDQARGSIYRHPHRW